ncbi:MAG: hypothetical protein HY904_22700 [Deltaproteobacteria bacterium]|nr:hypothetical protein [Deltaproteobacteria bacterium]
MAKPTHPPAPKSTLGERWNDPVGLSPDGSAPRVPSLAGRYFVVGDRPVRTVATPGGGMDVEALDWATGEFVRAMQYLTRVSFPDGEVDEVDAAEFNTRVQRVRAGLASRRG